MKSETKMVFIKSNIALVSLRLFIALVLAVTVLYVFVKSTTRSADSYQNEIMIKEALWIDPAKTVHPVRMDTSTPLGLMDGVPCCDGTYRFDLVDAVNTLQKNQKQAIPALYLPAVSCGSTADVGKYSISLDDLEFTSIGPVIPLPEVNRGEDLFAEISISCSKNIFSGIWRAAPIVGDSALLTKRQRAERNMQVHVPFVSAILFALFAFAFAMVFLYTERSFTHYRDVAIAFALCSLFLLFLAGIFRGAFFNLGTTLHLPVRMLASLGMFLVIGTYNDIFFDRPLSLRARRFTIYLMLMLFICSVISSMLENIGLHVAFSAIGVVVWSWPIIYWPLYRVRIFSIVFFIFVMNMVAAFGATLDAVNLLSLAFTNFRILPFFDRLTLNLFMTIALIVFFQHFIKLYRDHKIATINAAKASAVGRAIQMVVHDIRKPFTTLRFGIESLIRNINDPKKLEVVANRLSEDVNKNIKRVNYMLHDVMQFGAKTQLLYSTFSLNSLLKDVCHEMIIAYPQAKGRLRFAPTDEIMIDGDNHKLFRAFYNIVENAVQASEPQGQVTIQAKTYQYKKLGVEIEVHNTDSFIPKDKHGKIFEDFYSEGKVGGTGLGLAVSKEIVESHGGEISCDSQIITGTTFKILLPYKLINV